MNEFEDELQELAQRCDLAEKTITKPPIFGEQTASRPAF